MNQTKAKQKPRNRSANTIFHCGAHYFKYHCNWAGTEVQAGQGRVGIVMDGQKVFGSHSQTRLNANGTQTVLLMVASKEGGFTVLAETAARGAELCPGDPVLWVPEYQSDILKSKGYRGDPRCNWVGLIVAKAALEVHEDPTEIIVESWYRPSSRQKILRQMKTVLRHAKIPRPSMPPLRLPKLPRVKMPSVPRADMILASSVATPSVVPETELLQPQSDSRSRALISREIKYRVKPARVKGPKFQLPWSKPKFEPSATFSRIVR